MILPKSVSSFLSIATLTIATLHGSICSGKQRSEKQSSDSTSEKSESTPTSKRFEPWGYGGSILLVGSSASKVADDVIAEFKKRIPKSRTTVVIFRSSTSDSSQIEQFSAHFAEDFSVKSFALPQSGNSPRDTDDGQSITCIEAVRAAGGVWITEASRAELVELSKNAPLRRELHELLQRGGVVAASGASCGLLGQVAELSSSEAQYVHSNELQGFGLMPQSRIAVSKDRGSSDASASGPHADEAGRPSTDGTVELRIDSSSAVILRGRTLRLIGQSGATVSLGPADYRPTEIIQLNSNDFADWTQLCRAARDRLKNVDPGNPAGTASLRSGSLVIVGGGSMPRSVVDKFVELAGGPSAKIVYLPTAVPPSEAPETTPPSFFANAGVAKVTVLNQRGGLQVESDEFRDALNEATAVWFGGGRQWNFVDAYEDTQAIELFHGVLERGGVIGGSSAGATIQGEFLVRGHPLGNTVMMAEGYERGFSFLPGSAIDQHFSQRNRFADLENVIRKHQELLGVGIDEGTALVVQPKICEVIGNGSVYLMRASKLNGTDASGTAKSRFTEVPSGSKVDLISLEVSQ